LQAAPGLRGLRPEPDVAREPVREEEQAWGAAPEQRPQEQVQAREPEPPAGAELPVPPQERQTRSRRRH
jgi:hypothetical protein